MKATSTEDFSKSRASGDLPGFGSMVFFIARVAGPDMLETTSFRIMLLHLERVY